MLIKWTSDVAIAQSQHQDFEELLWWCTILFIACAMSVAAFIWGKLLEEASSPWMPAAPPTKKRPSVLNQTRKPLRLKTPGSIDEAFPRLAALQREVLAMSPVREVAGPHSARHCATADFTNPVLLSKETHREPAALEKMQQLELSGVIHTINIPPLTPEQIDEVAIAELSEMLQRW